MDYRTAYERISRALWAYDQSHSEAYIRLMQEIRDIDRAVTEGHALPPIRFAPGGKSSSGSDDE